MKTSIIVSILIASIACNWADHKPFCHMPLIFPVSLDVTSKQLSIDLYSGLWYEIARTPNSFQKDCLCSQATYEHNTGEKSILVNNVCITSEGPRYGVKGEAYPVNDHNSKLIVIFKHMPANYWVLDFDEVDYQWAIVGEPCRENAWVLSRTKDMQHDLLAQKLSLLRKIGFKVSDFVFRDPSC